jgi:hypothetical protein
LQNKIRAPKPTPTPLGALPNNTKKTTPNKEFLEAGTIFGGKNEENNWL